MKFAVSLRQAIAEWGTVRNVKGGYNRKEFRRRSQRFRLAFPALLWGEKGSRAQATRTRTKDISPTGLYLYGEFPHRLGSTILFEVQLPPPFAGGTGSLLQGQGTLVRYEVRENKRIGLAARIDRYEFRPLTKTDTENGPEAA